MIPTQNSTVCPLRSVVRPSETRAIRYRTTSVIQRNVAFVPPGLDRVDVRAARYWALGAAS